MLLDMLSVYNLCIFAHVKVIKTYRQNRKIFQHDTLPPTMSMQHKNDHLLQMLFMIQLFVHVNRHQYKRLDIVCAFNVAQKLKSYDNWACVFIFFLYSKNHVYRKPQSIVLFLLCKHRGTQTDISVFKYRATFTVLRHKSCLSQTKDLSNY